LQAAQDWNLDLESSILIGDKLSDIQAAERAGVGRAYLFETSLRGVLTPKQSSWNGLLRDARSDDVVI
jgi:histidinol phosphatase-like enzyme